MRRRRRFLTLCACAVHLLPLFPQTITTASVFFASVSEHYARLKDYAADLAMSTGSGTRAHLMRAKVIFKYPDRLRLDFSSPAEQTIVFTRDSLTIYLPTSRVALVQSVAKDDTVSAASLASPHGLALMKRFYTIAYETSSSPVPLGPDSGEMVVALVLNRKSAAETFKSLRVLVSAHTKLIRRIEAWPLSGEKITFDFSHYRLNVGIPDTRFLYDVPPTANVVHNFLFAD